MDRIRVVHCILRFARGLDMFAFSWIEFHIPLELPLFQGIQVLLQLATFIRSSVDHSVISEEASMRFYTFRQVIDVNKEQ